MNRLGTRKQHQHHTATDRETSRDQNQNSKRMEKRFSLKFRQSLLLLLPLLQLHNFVHVQYALPLVHLRRFAAPDSACEVVHPVLVYAGAAHDVGFEAEDADRGWGSELHLMAVAQFQEQLAALALCPCLEANSDKL